MTLIQAEKRVNTHQIYLSEAYFPTPEEASNKDLSWRAPLPPTTRKRTLQTDQVRVLLVGFPVSFFRGLPREFLSQRNQKPKLDKTNRSFSVLVSLTRARTIM